MCGSNTLGTRNSRRIKDIIVYAELCKIAAQFG